MPDVREAVEAVTAPPEPGARERNTVGNAGPSGSIRWAYSPSPPRS